MFRPGESELILCSVCGYEKELYYDDQDSVISEASCRCKRKVKLINGMKPLDWAIKQIEKDLLKIKRGIK